MRNILFSAILALTVVAIVVPSEALAQKSDKPVPQSPVFKKTKRPVDIIPLPESDTMEMIWQAFLVARKAAAGDKFAQHELGLRYMSGSGVERDTVKAARWFSLAAAQGLTASRFNLSILTFHGWGVRWDPFESYRLMKQCAGDGMVEGEFLLASFLTEGLAVERDWQKAYDWVKKAADAGYEPAKKALPEIEARLKKDEKKSDDAPLPFFSDPAQDSALASSDPKLLKDAFHGVSELREALGITKMLDDTSRVDSSALAVVRRGALYGSPEALTVLGRSYERGIEVTKDSIEAAALYVRAIRLNSPRATSLMAALLEKPSFISALKSRTEHGDQVAEFVTAGLAGLGIEAGVNESRAQYLLKRAADSGYVPAIVELGLWHYSGRVGFAVNQARATELWYKAASLGSVEASIRLAVTALLDTAVASPRATYLGLLRAAAAEGSVLAEVALGYAYERGVGVDENEGEAARYYRSAASRGSQDAFRALRRMYDRVRPEDPEFQLPDIE